MKRYRILLVMLLFPLIAGCPKTDNSNDDSAMFMQIIQFLNSTNNENSGLDTLPVCGEVQITTSTSNWNRNPGWTMASPNALLMSGVGRPLAGCTPNAYSGTIGAGNIVYNSNKLFTTTVLNGVTTTYTYNGDGYLTGISTECQNAAAGYSTRSLSYNAQDRVAHDSIITPADCNASGNPATEQTMTTTYTYSGNTRVMTSSIDTITSISEYDGEDRLSSSTMSCSGTCTGLGGDGASAVVTISYNASGQLIQESCVGGTINMCGSDFTATLSYDSENRLAGISGGNGTTLAPTSATFTYNDQGQVTQASQTYGSTTYTTDFTN